MTTGRRSVRPFPMPTDCATCRAFAYVQRSPGRWYPCPACRGSGRNDLLGDMDPSHCVRDSTLDPSAHHNGEKQSFPKRWRLRKRDRDRAARKAKGSP